MYPFLRWVLFALLLVSRAVVHGANVFCDRNIPGHHAPFSKSCYVNELITLTDGERLNFLNVHNASEITDVKFLTVNRMHSNIRIIPEEIFDYFPNVEVLILAASIQTISRNALEKATNLRELILNDQIQVVQRNVFSSVPTLTNLELNQNRIVAIEDGAFNGLENLEFLNLANNELVALGYHTFSGLSRLRFLKLRQNNIGIIDDGALAFPHLEMLDLSHNKLKSLSDSVFSRLPVLRSLSLDHNELYHIGYALYDISTLDNIDLSSNHIEDLNLVEFSTMPALSSLWLRESGFNFATAFDANGGGYPTPSKSPLKYLDIADNQLQDDASVMKLSLFKDLENLALEGNNFTCFDFGTVTFRRLFPKLERVQMSDNKWECNCLEEFAKQLQWDGIRVIANSFAYHPNRRTVEDIVCY